MILDVQIEPRVDGVTVVTLRGQLTLGTSLKVAETRVEQLLQEGSRLVVLDVSGVPYMDSAGLGTLVYLGGRAQEQGGALRLAGVTERVEAMLRMSRTDTLIPRDADVKASLRAVAG